MDKNLKIIYLLTICAFSFVTAFSQTNKNENKKKFSLSRMDSINRTYINTKYPPFEIEKLDGGKINNSSLLGKITVLNFWFEDCAPCKQELPTLNAINMDYSGNPKFQLIGITFDPREDARKVVEKFGLNFPIALTSDINSSQKMNFGNGFPTTIIIDEDGKVIYLHLGKVNYSKTDVSDNLYPILHKLLK